MASYIAIVHVFTFACVLSFDIPVFISAVAVFMILASLAWSIKKWSGQRYIIKYESIYKCWSVSIDAHLWQRYDSVRVVYLNDALVWIILASPGRVSRAVVIGVNTMPDERFMQLRRCILCPDMFDR